MPCRGEGTGPAHGIVLRELVGSDSTPWHSHQHAARTGCTTPPTISRPSAEKA